MIGRDPSGRAFIRVIGLDPGYRSFGYATAVLTLNPGAQVSVAYDSIGVWNTDPDRNAQSKTEDTTRRMKLISAGLLSLANSWSPAIFFTEAPQMGFGLGKATPAVMVNQGRARGIVDGVAEAHGIDTLEIQPRVMKKSVTDDSKATKHQMAMALDRFYPGVLELFPTRASGALNMGAVEHGADAALTIHALRQHPAVIELLTARTQ